MGLYTTRAEDLATTTQHLLGWTVVGVETPTASSESYFTLVLTREGATKRVEVGGTDLGFWLTELRPPKTKKNKGPL